MINCEHNLCIYNTKGKCDLQNVSISPLGDCEDCMLPNIPDNILQRLKQETLDKLTTSKK